MISPLVIVILKTYITPLSYRQHGAQEVRMLEPRLKSSIKWAPFPQELLMQIRKVFQEHFPEQKILGEFIIEGRIYPEEVLLRVGFLHKGWIRQNNFEVSSNLKNNKMTVLECIHLCVDLAGVLFQENAPPTDAEEKKNKSIDTKWLPIEFEGQELFYKFSTDNSELEKEADKILGLKIDEELFNAPLEDIEELHSKLEQMGLATDEDSEEFSEEEPSLATKKPNKLH